MKYKSINIKTYQLTRFKFKQQVWTTIHGVANLEKKFCIITQAYTSILHLKQIWTWNSIWHSKYSKKKYAN